MSQRFQVPAGASIVLPGASAILQAGDVITLGDEIVVGGGKFPPLTKSQIEEHLKSGFLRVYQGEAVAQVVTPEQLTDKAPGTTVPPALPSTADPNGLDSREALRLVDTPPQAPLTPVELEEATNPVVDPATVDKVLSSGTVNPENPGVTTSSTQKVEQVQSLWVLDPAQLSGKDLDQLNVMIAERDASVRPFEDAVEAAAWLSKDFKPFAAV